MHRNFAKRDLKEFNKIRSIIQRIVCTWILGSYLRLRYKVIFQGSKKVHKNDSFIVASNHVSNWDPFIICDALRKNSIAFMAKQELFEKATTRLLMNWCGAFAVNREKVEVATLRTALSLKNSKWNLGIFPQGTRQKFGDFSDLNKGFATLAKSMKTNILPVAIIGSDKKAKFCFMKKNEIIVRIGDIIPFSDNIDEMMEQWKIAMKHLMEPEYATI